MAHSLNPNISMESGTRLVPGRPRYTNDAETELQIEIDLRTPPATNYLICRRFVTIRNGPATSDKLVKNTPPVDGDHGDRLAVQRDALTLANNIVATLQAAYDGGGSTPAQRRDALATALRTAGVLDPVTLPGS